MRRRAVVLAWFTLSAVVVAQSIYPYDKEDLSLGIRMLVVAVSAVVVRAASVVFLAEDVRGWRLAAMLLLVGLLSSVTIVLAGNLIPANNIGWDVLCGVVGGLLGFEGLKRLLLSRSPIGGSSDKPKE